MKAILSSLVKAIRYAYPNDERLEADCITGELTIYAKDGTTRKEDQSKQSEYLGMLGDLYGFKTVSKIVFYLESKAFEITGTDEKGVTKIVKE